jgi:addiction module RelB/DinJ family antitoxin
MATKTATVRARIEPGVKEEAERILEELGLSPTQALVAFYRAIIRQRGLPFALREPNATPRMGFSGVIWLRTSRNECGSSVPFAAIMRTRPIWSTTNRVEVPGAGRAGRAR